MDIPNTTQIVNLGKLLAAGMLILGEYRKVRDAILAKGDPVDPQTGTLYTDAQLIAMFQQDAQSFVAHVDEIIAKHTGPGA